MKFVYTYHTRENKRETGCVVAPSKEAAFAALKERGVRPIRVDLAPGVFNRLLSIGKRGLAIVLLALALAASVVWAFLGSGADDDSPLDRRQFYGDRAQLMEIMRKGNPEGEVLADDLERFLAAYSQPGQIVRIPEAALSNMLIQVDASLGRDVILRKGEPVTHREMKRIVQGMKIEMREFIRDGGTAQRYFKRLAERQAEEAAYYEKMRREFELARKVKSGGALYDVWQQKNAELRDMGLKSLPFPQELSKGGNAW